MEQRVGVVKKYSMSVAEIAVEKSLSVGETIRILGPTNDLTQVVESIDIAGHQVNEAASGAKVGVVIHELCGDGDVVYKIREAQKVVENFPI